MAYAKKVPFYKEPMCPAKQMPMEDCTSDAECPDDCDLYLLRDAAADERNAIAFYLRAAHTTCLEQLFLDVAEDEMQHFIKTMQLVSMLDPVQAEMFEEVGLDSLVSPTRLNKKQVKWQMTQKPAEDVEVVPPALDEMDTVDILTKAIDGELKAANKYQEYMLKAEHPEVRDLFCELMNEEKEHIAEFTKALWCITHEPLPPETD